MAVVLRAWDGKLHYEGAPDRFARTRALFQKEPPVPELDFRIVGGGIVALLIACWVWLLCGQRER